MLMRTDDRIDRARLLLEQRGIAAAGLLAAEIAASWQRCLAAGLDPSAPPAPQPADAAALRAARERHELARRLALAEMQSLYHQIAGTNFMIAFAAPDGMLLDAIADVSFRSSARAAGIRPGCLWSEALCGTNALGTVAATGQPVTVHGGEHFFRRFDTLTCTAVPVFAPDASLAGVLDASSDCRSRQQHTRALVGMAAKQVENGLFREHHRRDLVIAFHSRAEYLRTLSVALLAIAPDGRVLGANAQARFLLQGLPARPGSDFAALFRTSLGGFLDATRRQEQATLQDRVGSSFIATIETPRPTTLPALAVPPRAQPATGTNRTADFVAADPAMQAALERVRAAAARGLPILLRGETGTGKEHLARYAHQAGGRSGAFVPVNCAALPRTLIESELFGHADGAFSGARRGGAPGLVVEADRGTLFLDEIGEMPPDLQSVLLRLLDDWTVRPVGSFRQRRVDVLLVAATHADLAAEAASGRFRRDLYHRLSTVDVTLPPLRARQDFAAIAEFLLARIAPMARLGEDALAALAAWPWPGNVRELRAALTRLTLLDPARMIDAAALAELGPAPPAPATGAQPLRATVRERVIATLRETETNISETARRLRVSRNTVYRVLERDRREA
ncbi:MAG TPA: sigma-54-dependent Fis family transcriptional regulator [Acetobacteraceae bacterium]|nr:sigma-54-dependent Fis family transcriptional regulator [Acetobacteraceae bacterium]